MPYPKKYTASEKKAIKKKAGAMAKKKIVTNVRKARKK